MRTVSITFTFDEINCISTSVGRDQDRVLDERSRRAGIEPDGRTRLLTEVETSCVPFHQAVLLKIEEALQPEEEAT